MCAKVPEVLLLEGFDHVPCSRLHWDDVPLRLVPSFLLPSLPFSRSATAACRRLDPNSAKYEEHVEVQDRGMSQGELKRLGCQLK